ncbi:hypothetical protein M5689_000884 [Euphorbia peplus]|nr:hypothetical protein M5689_000884 [Euphorbia peplus]
MSRRGRRGSGIWAKRGTSPREASFRSARIPEERGGDDRVTPRQTCPRPEGFGRNLRSKTRWFARSCNSHQVSHFAAFFIDARAEISVAESRFGSQGSRPARPFRFRFLGASCAGVLLGEAADEGRDRRASAPFPPGPEGRPPPERRSPGLQTRSQVVLLSRFRQ